MLTQSILVSGFAVALAAASANPVVTPAPQRRQLGDILDSASDLVGDIGEGLDTLVGDIGDDINTLVDDIGDELAGLTKCISAVSALVTEIPTPTDSALASAITSAYVANGFTEACIGDSMPQSLSSAYAAYESSAVSWYNENRGQLSSALAECPTLPAEFSSALITPCSTAAGLETGAVGPGNGGGDNDDSNGPDGGDDEGAAPKLTGVLAGVAAVAVGVGAILL